jgi:flavin-dependent dehydrogenase
MLSSVVSKKKINLKEMLQQLLITAPCLKERFKYAKPLETIKGYGLPLGSKRRNISGERFLLTGDAASLIDPFSGEGISNAIESGRIAADHIIKCFKHNNYTLSFNKNYDKEVYKNMWKELKVSRALQRFLTYPWIYNLIVKKINKNKYFHKFLIDALINYKKRKRCS